MPQSDAAMTGPVPSVSTVPEIPLYLIPRVVADQINEKRESVFSITITRSHGHYYTIVVVTHQVQKPPSKVSFCPPRMSEGSDGEPAPAL
jgi:hypothetical protein